jgi:hypothetical protein
MLTRRPREHATHLLLLLVLLLRRADAAEALELLDEVFETAAGEKNIAMPRLSG